MLFNINNEDIEKPHKTSLKRHIRELFWKVWWRSPWCSIKRHRLERKARESFDYEKNKDISIIAVNCIGGELYSILGLKFTSPLINSSLKRDDFVLMATNFEAYMKGHLDRFFYNSTDDLCCYLVPEGDLPPVVISWPHDHDKQIVIDNFNKRRARINYDKLVFITDSDGLSDDSYELFRQVKGFKKVILTHASNPRTDDFIEKLNVDSAVGLQYKKLSGIFRFQEIWDFVSWFNK